jgi:Fic family protein
MAAYVKRTWAPDLAGQSRRARQPCEYAAYIPDHLVGRELDVPAMTTADLADAERAVMALQAQEVGLANIEPLARLLLRAEAVASSYIEGLQVGVRRLAKEELVLSTGLGSHDDTARSVLGNVAAMQAALDLAATRGDIGVSDVRNLHATLLAGTRDERWGGVVRQEQN